MGYHKRAKGWYWRSTVGTLRGVVPIRSGMGMVATEGKPGDELLVA